MMEQCWAYKFFLHSDAILTVLIVTRAMKKRIKIWFHSGDSSDIREVSLRKPVAMGICLFILGTICGLSYLGYDYYLLKKEAFDNNRLGQTDPLQHALGKLSKRTLCRPLEADLCNQFIPSLFDDIPGESGKTTVKRQ